MNPYKKIQIIISFIFLIILWVHIFYPKVEIDLVTMLLLILVWLPWASPLLKSLELTWVWKIEFQDIKSIVDTTKELSKNIDNSNRNKDANNHFKSLYESDPLLAFASIRIELEQKLKKLWEKYNIDNHRGIRFIVNDLSKNWILSDKEKKLYHDILPILNLAIHGEQFDMEASKWLIETAPEILKYLDQKFIINNM